MTFEEWWKARALNQFNPVIKATAEDAWQAARAEMAREVVAELIRLSNNETTISAIRTKLGGDYDI
jgi:hypothetical protein